MFFTQRRAEASESEFEKFIIGSFLFELKSENWSHRPEHHSGVNELHGREVLERCARKCKMPSQFSKRASTRHHIGEGRDAPPTLTRLLLI